MPVPFEAIYTAIAQDDPAALAAALVDPSAPEIPVARATVAWRLAMGQPYDDLAEAIWTVVPPPSLEASGSTSPGGLTELANEQRAQVYLTFLSEAATQGKLTWVDRLLAVLTPWQAQEQARGVPMTVSESALYLAVERAEANQQAVLLGHLWQQATPAERLTLCDVALEDAEWALFETLAGHFSPSPSLAQWQAWARHPAEGLDPDTVAEMANRDRVALRQVLLFLAPHLDAATVVGWLAHNQADWNEAPLPGLMEALTDQCLANAHAPALRTWLADEPDAFNTVRQRVVAHDRAVLLQDRPASLLRSPRRPRA